MSESKPMTEYYNHKYKHETLATANVQSILDEVNDLQRQVTEIKIELGSIKEHIDVMGQCIVRSWDRNVPLEHK
jgi:hypothetical protein